MESMERSPLEVFAVDEKMNRRTGPIPYKSLRWVRRYREPGEFEMTVPADVFDPSWAYICCDDRPETGMVQKVAYSDDSQTYAGVDSVTVAGFFLEAVLDRVVFLAESPEQEKVYVPEPVRPVAAKGPKVYTDGAAGFYVETGDDEVVDVETGKHYSKSSLHEVGYKQDASTGGGHPAYSYYGKGGEVVRVDWNGKETSFEKAFEDGRGNVWYYDAKHGLHLAQGIVDRREETYWVEKKRWDALADDDPYGRYYMQTVKGPWQRTEMMEPVTEGDSVDIVFGWARRMMGDWLLYAEPEFEGVVKKVDPSFRQLGGLMYSTLAEVGASLRLEYLFERNAFILSAWKGRDRTQGQTENPWAVFSDTWGTIRGFEASRDESNYRNTCYTLFEYDVPASFDEAGWPVSGFIWGVDDDLWTPTLYGIAHESRRGYLTDRVGGEDEPAMEAYLDLRKDKPTCDGDWDREMVEIPASPPEQRQKALEAARKKFAKPADAYDMRAVYAAYEADLKTRGKAFLREEHPVEVQLDTGIVRTDRYLKDWDLGDVVDMAVEAVGLAREARIVEVEEVYEAGRCEVNIEAGDRILRNAKGGR